MNHPEEVVWVTFPTCDDAARVMEPGEHAFDLPATPRATERAPVLSDGPPVRAMSGNHFNVVLRAQVAIERIAVVAAIPDQAGRERFDKPRGERGIDETGFITLTLIDRLAESSDPPPPGTIGIQARKELQRIPSSIYWNGLKGPTSRSRVSS
jgi:hypothetical protein